jgi:acetyl esterase
LSRQGPGSLHDLPPATIFTAALDPLRDEGEDYADLLAQGGVAVTLTRVYGMLHGSWSMEATGDRAYQLGLDVAGALRRARASRPQTSE